MAHDDVEMRSPMSSSSSSSQRVAGGENLFHRLAANLLLVEAAAVKATTAGPENPRGEGEGTQRGGRGGRQGWSRSGG